MHVQQEPYRIPRAAHLGTRPFTSEMHLTGLDLIVSHLRLHPDDWERVTSDCEALRTDPTSTASIAMIPAETTATLLAITALITHCGVPAIDTLRTLMNAGHEDTSLMATICRAGLTSDEAMDIPPSLSEGEREVLLQRLGLLGALIPIQGT